MGMTEIVLVLVVALIVFGPDDLPKIARTLGKFFSQGRRIYQGFAKDFRDMLNEPVRDLKSVESDIKRSLSKTIDLASIMDDSSAGSSKDMPKDAALPDDARDGCSSDAPLLQYEDLEKANAQAVNPLEALPQELVQDKRTEPEEE